jgi:tetratricopeptide (TPR) repeat protein
MNHAKVFSTVCLLAIALPAGAICQEQALGDSCWAKARDKTDAISICADQIRDRGLRGKRLAELYAGRGFAYVLSKEYAPAISDYDEAVKLWPGSWSIRFDRAMAHALSGDMERATDDFAQVVALNPKYYLAAIDKRASELEALGDKTLADAQRAYSLNFLLRLICRDHPTAKQVCPSDIVRHAVTGEFCMVCGPPSHLAPAP